MPKVVGGVGLQIRSPLLEKLSFEKGGMHGLRHHRVSTLVMAGVSKDLIKDQIGHGWEEIIKRYTHLQPEFIQNELDRVRNFVQIGRTPRK